MMRVGKSCTIIFEGISGSGKSVRARALTDRLREAFDVVLIDATHPVYAASQDIRKYVVAENPGLLSESLLHQFTTWARTERQVGAADIAILDRFVLSNLVYFLASSKIQGRAVDVTRVRQSILFPFGIDALAESHTFFIDCPVNVAAERCSRRTRTFDYALQENAREQYFRELTCVPNITCFDGARSPEVLDEEIYARVRGLL